MSTTVRINDRDREIVTLIASGRSVADVASTLNVACATIYRRLARPAVKASLAAARAEAWRPVSDELRGGVVTAVRRLVHLAEHAQHESTQVRASIAICELAMRLDE